MAFFFNPEMLMNGELTDEDGIEFEILTGDFFIPDVDRPTHSPLPQKPKVPSCTEDGIPIRKIYVANLPLNVKRQELHDFFAQYGQIKNCWVKALDSNIKPYAFITFINPKDAHKALKAPRHKNFLRGKMMRVQPADSWHQPISGPDGTIIWDNRKPTIVEKSQDATTQNDDQAGSSQQGAQPAEEMELTILDILNPDCLAHILSYVSIRDLVRSELVSKRWQAMVNDYYLSFRTFMTSSWDGNLTTAMLRHLLQRMGPSLTSLIIDYHGDKLNDRTAHTIGKFCPNLERLAIQGMSTVNWNPVLYSCKNLHTLAFKSCPSISDHNLSSLFSLESSIHSLSLYGMENIYGSFLDKLPPKLRTLEMCACPGVMGDTLAGALPKMAELKSLKLNTVRGFGAISAMAHLTKLEELLLCNFMYESSTDLEEAKQQLVESISKMTELRSLSLVQHTWFSDELLKTIAGTCKKLRKLTLVGAGKEGSEDDAATLSSSGLAAIARQCSELEFVNVSQNPRMGECVAALAGAEQLRTLVARGSDLLTEMDVLKCVQSCHHLELIDLFGCTHVTEGLVTAVISELEQRPRHMTIYLGETAAEEVEELPKHPLLTIDFSERFASKQFVGFYIDTSDLEDDDDESDLDGADFYDMYDSSDEYMFGRHHGYDIETGEYVDDELLDDLF